MVLLKSMEKSLQHLQSVYDNMSGSLAQMGGALSQAPVDSAGQTRALDLLMAITETQREHAESIERYDQAMGEFKEASREHVLKTQELGAVIFELRDRFIDQFGAHSRQFSTYTGPQLQPVNRGPTVIDLQSRIARPSNFATVTYPDGRISMVPEDQLH